MSDNLSVTIAISVVAICITVYNVLELYQNCP